MKRSFAFLLVYVLTTMINILNAQTFVISPPDSFVFDCNRGTEYVTFLTADFDIDTEELTLSCNGEVFDTSSERFSEVFLGVQFELSLESYMPNDTINLCLHNLTDSIGEWYYDSICWQYYMIFDNTPPTFRFVDTTRFYTPLYPGDTVNTFNVLMFWLSDSSGIDTPSVSITVEDFEFYVEDYGVWFFEDTLLYRVFPTGMHFETGDNYVEICIHAEDAFEPCPNSLDTCFQIYLAPRDYCPCKAGFYMARWQTITELFVTIDQVIDSLSVKYEYFKLDDEEGIMDPCSLDVYYVQPWNGRRLPDSTIQKVHDFVYNGGILYLISECTHVLDEIHEFLKRDGEWFLGMEPRPTHVRDTLGSDVGYLDFSYYPPFPELDSVYKIDWAGSIKLSSPAKRIAGSSGYSYFYPHADSIDEYDPTVIAMSHFGRGTVFLHMDYSSIRNGLDDGPSYEIPGNMSINYDLPCCNHIPKFFHYPKQNSEFYCQSDTLSITTKITRFGILDPESLFVMWNDSIYDTSSGYIDVYDSSFVFNIPPGIYHDNDTLFMCIHNIIDTSGYWYYDSICWAYTFNIDEESPIFGVIEPSAGETLSVVERFSFTLSDSSYIDTMSILLRFEGDYEYDITHAALWKYADTVYFDPSVAGVSFGEVDSFLDICVHAEDANQDCTPQAIDTCWQVYLNASAIYENNIPSQYELSVYPNPFNSICNIDGVPGEKAEIFDQQGHLINTLILPNKWNATDMEGNIIPSGNYLIKTKTNRITVKYVR